MEKDTTPLASGEVADAYTFEFREPRHVPHPATSMLRSLQLVSELEVAADVSLNALRKAEADYQDALRQLKHEHRMLKGTLGWVSDWVNGTEQVVS